jgi:hypothetical protein
MSCFVIEKTNPVEPCIMEAAYFVCDISAVVDFCLLTNRPIFLYRPRGEKLRLSNSEVSHDSFCYVFSTPEELEELLKTVIVNGDDHKRDARKSVRDYFLSTDLIAAREFNRQLQRILDHT